MILVICLIIISLTGVYIWWETRKLQREMMKYFVRIQEMHKERDSTGTERE